MSEEIKEKIKAYYIGNDIDKVLDYIKSLQQENKQLKEKSDVLEENNKLLIQQKAQMYEDLDIAYEKIDKAIELIKRSAGYKGICTQPETDTFSKLLEILGGEE